MSSDWRAKMHAGRDEVVLTYPKHANVKKCNCINVRKIWDRQTDRHQTVTLCLLLCMTPVQN